MAWRLITRCDERFILGKSLAFPERSFFVRNAHRGRARYGTGVTRLNFKNKSESLLREEGAVIISIIS